MLGHLFEGARTATVLIGTFLALSSALLAQNSSQGKAASEFVEINSEIEVLSWLDSRDPGEGPRPQTVQIHAVVGKHKWAIGESFSGQTNYYSYDGTKILEWASSLGTNGSRGNMWTRSFESSDGNPNRTINASDHLDMLSRIAWLAFCSPATLNNPGHKLYPPWDLWKEYLDPSKFTERVDRFKDDLGVPKSLVILTDEHQAVVDYRVSGTTNIAGLTFPQSFYLLEYNPTGTKGWMLGFLAHGTVSTIARAAFPLSSQTQAQVDFTGQVWTKAKTHQLNPGQ